LPAAFCVYGQSGQGGQGGQQSGGHSVEQPGEHAGSRQQSLPAAGSMVLTDARLFSRNVAAMRSGMMSSATKTITARSTGHTSVKDGNTAVSEGASWSAGIPLFPVRADVFGAVRFVK
jgi:hypothetical protein